MIFVSGVHGVGKTQYCRILSQETGKKYYSASELILKNGQKNFHQKKVENINLNQNCLVEEVNLIRGTGIDFILDGHLCLLNQKGKIELINENVIRALKIDLLIVVVDKPHLIRERMKLRDGIIWDEQFIKKFQEKEIEYAKKLGISLNIDYKIVINNSEGEINYGKSIVLPVKSIYAEKIFSGEKRYEFRKTLCTENIDKIYLYVTSPIKKIVGDVEVLEKFSMRKNHLWELTHEASGISVEFFEQYFRNKNRACAYKLGKTVKYTMPIELKEMGIDYIPQSYLYVNTV